jgi:hypothetical protein
MATSDMPADMIEIEIDNFVSPNAANDAPSDEFIALEIDAPVALPTVDAPVALPSNVFADLASDLAAMPAPVSGTASGSLADGTMRGVGFSTAEGYVTALANGVKQATADHYLATLRSMGHSTEGLTITIIPESTVASGALAANGPLVVTHDGPDVFEARRLARGLQADARIAPSAVHVPAIPAQPEVSDAPVLPALDGSLVVESINERTHGLKLSWNPAEIARHSIPRAQLVEILENAGMGAFAPGIPAEKGQFGKIMKSFNSMDARDARGEDSRLTASCVTRRHFEQLGQEWPAGLESRYIVGHVDASPDLGSLGEKFLVCSLVEVAPEEFEVQFTGGNEMLRAAVSKKFDTLTSTAAMDVTMLLKWYVGTLARKFDAVRCGYAMLIVDNGSQEAQDRMERATALANALQGTDLYGPSPIMGRRLEVDRVVSRKGPTWGSFCAKLGAGLLSDLRDLEKEFSDAYTAAQDAARKSEAKRPDATDASIELAARRALIGSDRVNSKSTKLLGMLDAMQARATAMVNVIGDAARPAIARCEAMRTAWEPKCYGRSSNVLELD